MSPLCPDCWRRVATIATSVAFFAYGLEFLLRGLGGGDDGRDGDPPPQPPPQPAPARRQVDRAALSAGNGRDTPP